MTWEENNQSIGYLMCHADDGLSKADDGALLIPALEREVKFNAVCTGRDRCGK
jgi:hypothetical protein